MPATAANVGGGMPDDEVWMVISYLRTLSAPGLKEVTSGDTANGQKIFQQRCSSCHRVGARGGRLGPDLSRIGASRTRALLTREIRRPSEYLVPGYETVTLVTQEGERVTGVIKNEDTFSIQIVDTHERLRGFLKANLREVTKEPRSLMPAFEPSQLIDRDLDDLLAYLSSLRGQDASTQ
jgi:putative heme-binding domain-containing protein